ncbi:MAG: LD-carboxypeptidase [Clostridium sp.]|nr:LD-carboxypeptidase [Clostridium sp.]
MNRVEYGSKVGIVCCSNGQKAYYNDKLKILNDTLCQLGLIPVFSNYIYEKNDVFSGSAKERSEALMGFYKNPEIKAIFDISGGDIANELLEELDFDVIYKSDKKFFGYSDLTTIINAIYTKTGKSSVLYQVRNLIYDYRERQIRDFKESIINGKDDLFSISYKFVQGSYMEGIVVGGNIRCFLKLAGTAYFPNLKGKIILLEGRGGLIPQMVTYLSQLKQIGAFKQVSGILLGTFTELEKEKIYMEELIKNYVDSDMPIAVTGDIGHGMDSKGIEIGKRMVLFKE